MSPVQSKADLFFEQLFYEQHSDLKRSARSMVKKYGARGLDVDWQVEELLQETMIVVDKTLDEVLSKEDPFGWVCGIMQKKSEELRREDNRWMRNLMLVPLPKASPDPAVEYEKREVLRLLTKNEYFIMHQLYCEGYSYDELSREMGITKTNLTTKVCRIKKRIRKKYKKSEN